MLKMFIRCDFKLINTLLYFYMWVSRAYTVVISIFIDGNINFMNYSLNKYILIQK